MSKGYINWSYLKAKKFLIMYNFVFINANGSHHYFNGHYAGRPRIVTIPFHSSKSIAPATMKSIIIQSGIEKELWFKNQKPEK